VSDDDGTNKNDALLLATELGWRIFPIYEIGTDGKCACGKECSSPGKHPRVRNGVNDATSDPLQITAWWNTWPFANIAIATGWESGVVVVDLDVKGDLNGVAAWEALGIETDTLEAKSGSGVGRHLFFRAPDFARIKSTASRIGPGIDTRGEGGYLLVHPSNHISGGVYEWLNDRRLAPYPEELVELTKQGTHAAGIASQGGGTAESVAPGRFGPGQRNDSLTRIAGMLRAKGLPESAIFAALLDENQTKCDPPLERDEVERIASSVSRYAPGAFYHLSEKGNAERMVHLFGDRFRWVNTWNRWTVWDERRWALNGADVVLKRCALRTIETMHVEAASLPETDPFGVTLKKWAKVCEKHSMVAAMVNLSAPQPGVAINHTELDVNPMLYNVLNGTVDLKTGRLTRHNPDQHITQLASVEYNPDAQCPAWERFVLEVCDGDRDLAGYLQRAVGYSLTGDVREHVLFFCYGRGENGKSTFLETVLGMMGDYGKPGAPGLLLEKKGDGHPTEVADLYGARLVSCQEVDENRAWAEATVKQLTGGDTISARRMREDYWTFHPTHKLWVSANAKPYVREATDGVWRRLKLIPFTVSFKGRADKDLKVRLRKEMQGIFNWALVGCFDWLDRGLDEPARVREASEAYREEQDVLGPWMGDCVERSGSEARATRQEVYRSYLAWCNRSGEKPISARRFANELRIRGFEDCKVGKTATAGWRGIGLRQQSVNPFHGIDEVTATGVVAKVGVN
jgi:putative DNA primase/helicase